MSDPKMTPEEAKEFIQTQLDRWSYLVTSYGFKFDVHWCANGHEMPAGDEECYGCSKMQHRYLEGNIYFNLHSCAELSKPNLEEVVVHELTHFLLNPMQDDNGAANTERCTTMVSRLFMGLRDGGAKQLPATDPKGKV